MEYRSRAHFAHALIVFISLLPLVTPPVDGAEPPATAAFAGHWEGALAIGEHRLRIFFDLSASEDGSLSATFDSPDQGASGLPVESATATGESLLLEITVLPGGATYEGRLSEDGQKIEGEWRQSGQVLPLNVEKVKPEEDSSS